MPGGLKVKKLLWDLGSKRGQAAWEFLLVLPFIVIIMLVLVDFGLWMYKWVSIANAVREGARYGAVTCAFANQCGSSAGAISNAIKQRVVDRAGGIFNDLSKVEVGWVDRNGDGANNSRGDSIVVRVNWDNNQLLFIPVTMGVYSCADMMLEQTYTVGGLPSTPPCSQ